MKNFRFLFGVLCAVFSLYHAQAQHTFKGVVTDAATGQPVESATVRLLQGGSDKLVNFALTDEKGAFVIITKLHQADSLQIAVSVLGYKTVKQSALSGAELRIQLEQEAFALKEVVIRPGRIWGQQDTINYDVAQFLTSQDESIKDVIKKLPGMDVDDVGKISYNGKNITDLYVEGMDVAGGKYNQITNNLDAKAVETVQLLENHQPIRMLQRKVKTENIALNLKLKPEFRSKWMVTVRGGLGASPLLWTGSANALQLSRESQSVYTYKGNNTGADVTGEQLLLTEINNGRLQEPTASSFLSQPSIMAPLKKERWLFNDMNTLSLNRLYKLNETSRFRLNAGYTHDERKQKRGSETTYYQQDDTVSIAEQSDSRIRSDEANLSLNFENNAVNKFLTNQFDASGNWDRSRSIFTGNQSVVQQIKTPGLNLRNDFKNLWNQGDYTIEARSLLRYNHLPAQLLVNETATQLNFNHFYTDNSLSVHWKKGFVRHQYAAGFSGQTGNIRSGYNAYLLPSWQLEQNKWYANISLPLVWTHFSGGTVSRAALNPSVYFNYKINYAWRFSLSGSYRELYDDIKSFYTAPYQTDYRHTIWTNGIFPTKQTQSYSAYGEYKNTLREFFATLSVGHIRTHSDCIHEQIFENGQMMLISRDLSNYSTGWTLRGTLSKGFYDWGMKASLQYQFSRSQAEQLSKGVRMPYRHDYMQFEPKLSWTPFRRFQADYQATLRYGGSKMGEETHLTPLWNIVRKLQLAYDWYPVEVNLSTDYYHNDVNSSKSVDAFFTDITFLWKSGKWQFEARVSNLFDRRQYRYTEYSSFQNYTSWINIRGREFLVTARYKF
ncbi:MAG: TonB-dependent receptor [Tannerella sp.]|jgi:hypothetical protein|nr:TonB-dependent receptor [Tannerella sp.]